MSARDALARLRELRAGRDITLPRGEAMHLVDRETRPRDEPPLDYAVDERLPTEARSMFGLCECTLLVSLAAIGLLSLWLGFGG